MWVERNSSQDKQYLNAEIYIPNAMHFEVDVQLSKSVYWEGMRWNVWSHILRSFYQPKGYALLCAFDEEKLHTKYRAIVFGKRKEGDTILYARSASFSSSPNGWPRQNIELKDRNVMFTSAVIRLNVSKIYGFRIDSVQLIISYFRSQQRR